MKNPNEKMLQAVLNCDTEAANKIKKLPNFDINHQDDKGNSFLHYAYIDFSIMGHAKMVQWLRENGADDQLKNNKGHKPRLLCEIFNNFNLA